jgi:high-affinity nickel-transport protein
VLIYKPWRRRVDNQRLRGATFEPLPTHDEGIPENSIRREEESTNTPIVTKTMGANVESVESTDAAGPHARP